MSEASPSSNDDLYTIKKTPKAKIWLYVSLGVGVVVIVVIIIIVVLATPKKSSSSSHHSGSSSSLNPNNLKNTKLIGSPSGVQNQGRNVVISGDGSIAAVGAPLDGGSIGAAFIYAFDNGSQSWVQSTKLVGSGYIGRSYQSAVSLSNDGLTLAIGGSGDNSGVGAVWIFTRVASSWTQQSKLVRGTDMVNQGYAVALSSDGNTLATGAPFWGTDVGSVFVFSRTGSTWTFLQVVSGMGSGAGVTYQGSSVSISSLGSVLVLGAPNDNNDQGAIWIFSLSNGVWNQVGNKQNLTNTENFGQSVCVNSQGDTIAACTAPYGLVAIYTVSNGIWTQQGPLLIPDDLIEGYTASVSLSLSGDGNTLILGNSGDNYGIGALWIFTRSGGIWTQQTQKFKGTNAIGSTSNQGYSVSVSSDGTLFIEGAPYDNSSVGAAWIFQNKI